MYPVYVQDGLKLLSEALRKFHSQANIGPDINREFCCKNHLALFKLMFLVLQVCLV